MYTVSWWKVGTYRTNNNDPACCRLRTTSLCPVLVLHIHYISSSPTTLWVKYSNCLCFTIRKEAEGDPRDIRRGSTRQTSDVWFPKPLTLKHLPWGHQSLIYSCMFSLNIHDILTLGTTPGARGSQVKYSLCHHRIYVLVDIALVIKNAEYKKGNVGVVWDCIMGTEFSHLNPRGTYIPRSSIDTLLT